MRSGTSSENGKRRGAKLRGRADTSTGQARVKDDGVDHGHNRYSRKRFRPDLLGVKAARLQRDPNEWRHLAAELVALDGAQREMNNGGCVQFLVNCSRELARTLRRGTSWESTTDELARETTESRSGCNAR